MVYQVFIKKSARRELDALPKKQKFQVERRIRELADNPRPPDIVALKGKRFAGLYRTSTGDYRIIYQVQENSLTVLVVKIGNRKDVYR